jgi:ribosome modulation factor
MKANGGVDGSIHIFLTSALIGGKWSASRLCPFTPEKRAPGTYWIGGWVDPRTGLDDVEKRKFLKIIYDRQQDAHY